MDFFRVLGVNTFLDSFHDAANIVFGSGGKYELVSAVAGGKIGAAYTALDDGRHIPQGIVAFKMAEGIVDLLEVIHVDHDNGVGFFGILAGELVDKLVEAGSVAKAGKGIKAGIGFNDEEVGIEHSGGVKHIEVNSGMPDKVNGRSNSAEKQKKGGQVKLPFEYFKRKNGVKGREKYGTAAKDKPDYVSVSIYKDILRI
jgi:hypothetical protein